MRRNVLPPENASATDTPSRQELLHLPWETGSEQPQIGCPHSATTSPRIKRRRCTSGYWRTRGSGCTSRRRTRRGSARSSGGSPNWSGAASSAAPSARWTRSRPHWRSGSAPGTKRHGHSSGPRPPTRSSTASAVTAHAYQDQDTRLDQALDQGESHPKSQRGATRGDSHLGRATIQAGHVPSRPSRATPSEAQNVTRASRARLPF
jgi:hypothetical protein